MNYMSIVPCDIANGEGCRVSVFVAGCENNCPGCFNPESHDYCAGSPFTKDVCDRVITMAGKGFIRGLSILGGDPMAPKNQKDVLDLIRAFKRTYPDKTVWLWTGYVFEDDLLAENGRGRTPYTDDILNEADVLIDGPFILAQRDITLKFRGSRNQRLIDLKTRKIM